MIIETPPIMLTIASRTLTILRMCKLQCFFSTCFLGARPYSQTMAEGYEAVDFHEAVEIILEDNTRREGLIGALKAFAFRHRREHVFNPQNPFRHRWELTLVSPITIVKLCYQIHTFHLLHIRNQFHLSLPFIAIKKFI